MFMPPPRGGGPRRRKRSTTILPVGVGRRSPGPTGAVGSTVDTGIGARSASRSAASLDAWYDHAPWPGLAQSLSVAGREPVAGASAAELDVTTHRSTPATRAASRTPDVPWMFTAAMVARSSGENEYSAAVWMTYRHPRSAGTSAPAERRSPVTVTTPAGASHRPRTSARTR